MATTRRGYAYPVIGRLPVAAIDTGLDTMFENALSFIAAPQAKKAALEKAGTLNARGVAEAARLMKSRAGTPAHPPNRQRTQGGGQGWKSWRMPETLSAHS